ncbi:hypothetical protein E4V42_13380 [Clostridium estertheticum]|uniref:Uncharacterized protein n=1 Tax=Clostridium estertheticum TaxID=238834 RepID=A0A5N7J345_9CLOT|nr:hypothetical protein [Clostridium estertheticum]MPQ32424.1 hypothetical protein [Clostridium estertheticum]MPQ63083.1 hypothetical protein [Clostridium estertheticum]
MVSSNIVYKNKILKKYDSKLGKLDKKLDFYNTLKTPFPFIAKLYGKSLKKKMNKTVKSIDIEIRK